MDDYLIFLTLICIIQLFVLASIICVTLIFKGNVFTIGKRQKGNCDKHEEVKIDARQAPNNKLSHSPTTANGQDDGTSTVTHNCSTSANLDVEQYCPTSDVPASKKQKVFSVPTELQPPKKEVKRQEKKRSGDLDVQIQMEGLIRDVAPGPSEELQEPETLETRSGLTTLAPGNHTRNIKKDQTMLYPLRQPSRDSSSVDQETENKIPPKDLENPAYLHPSSLEKQPSCAFPKDLKEDESGCDTFEKEHSGPPEEDCDYTGTEINLATKMEVNNPQTEENESGSDTPENDQSGSSAETSGCTETEVKLVIETEVNNSHTERERKYYMVVKNLKNKILQDAWRNADKTLYKNMGWKKGFITTSFRKNLKEYDDIMKLSLHGMPPLQVDVYTMWMRGHSPPDMSRCQVCNIRPPGSTCVGCGRIICDQRECVDHNCRDRVDKAFV